DGGTGTGLHFASWHLADMRRSVIQVCQAHVCGSGSPVTTQQPPLSTTVSPMQSLSLPQASGSGPPASVKSRGSWVTSGRGAPTGPGSGIGAGADSGSVDGDEARSACEQAMRSISSSERTPARILQQPFRGSGPTQPQV